MACEEHQASDKYKRQCQERIAAIAPASDQKASCADECKDPKDYMPWWYVLIAWPEGITTWAILFTLGAIIWQAVETRKAAEATKRSVKDAAKTLIQLEKQTEATEASVRMQGVAYYQWVEIVDWKTTMNPDGAEMNVSFCIVNPSNFPLSLKSVHVYFFGGKQKILVPGRFLLPKTPERLEGGHIDIGTDKAVTFRAGGKLALAITVSLSFTSILEEAVTQGLGGLLHCGEKPRFEQMGQAGRIAEPKKPEDQNPK
jgi:hypothetical protein